MKKNITIFLIVLGLFACKKEILHSIQEEQANDIIALLMEHGIKAEKVKDGHQELGSFNIVVDENDYGRSWSILRENGLPREKIRGLSDVYQRQGLISSSTEEKALLMQAIKGEVEKTLETMDNVIKARVIISISYPSQVPFSETKEPIGASVLLKVKRGSYVNKEAVKGILLGAVSSLDKDRINVEVVESSGGSQTKSVRMTYVGPFLLSETSARTFYLIFTGILFILSLLIILFFYFLYRKKMIFQKEVEDF